MEYIYLLTYGCSANKNNSEIILGILKQGGYEITNNIKLSDIIIFNTCIVKSKTISKIKRNIQDTIKLYPDKIVIIAGCMPGTDYSSLKKLFPKALLLGINQNKNILNLIKEYKSNALNKDKEKDYLKERFEDMVYMPKISENKLISITQISRGCLGRCSYCKTKISKGGLYSYPMDKILKSIESDLKNKAKEIWITSQDNASYGLDRGKNELIELLNSILNLKYDFKLRLGMSNPNNVYSILDDLITLYKNKKFFKFLHIPIQSASDKVLRDMGRDYEIILVEKIIKKFKKEIPDLTFATDIITSYPSEKEIDHKKNLDFINKYQPDVLNLSKFSGHIGTIAGKLKQLNKKIINKRSKELMEIHRKTAKKNKLKFLNKVAIVFVEKKTQMPEVYESRDENYNIVLIKSKDKSILGKNIKVIISEIGIHHMIGKII